MTEHISIFQLYTEILFCVLGLLMLIYLFSSPSGCVRQWCPLRTLSSQRPPPHCRNGASCGSSSTWLVALYYSTSPKYWNKTLSNKCESRSNITKISEGIRRITAFCKKEIASIVVSFASSSGEFDRAAFCIMFFFSARNSTPDVTRSAWKKRWIVWDTAQTYSDISFRCITIACRPDCHPTFPYTISLGAETVVGHR